MKHIVAVFFLLFAAAGFAPRLNAQDISAVFASDDVFSALEMNKLHDVVNKYYAILESLDPERATKLGYHYSDAFLTRRTYQNREQLLSFLKQQRQEINGIRFKTLSQKDKYDAQILRAMLDKETYFLENFDRLKNDPLYYLEPFAVIIEMMQQNYAAYETRAENAILRLEKYPDIALQARTNLKTPPIIWVKEAIQQCQSAYDSLAELAPLFDKYIAQDPLSQQKIDAALQAAGKSLLDYKGFLAGMLENEGADFRVGAEMYSYYLKNWHLIGKSNGAVLSEMKANYEEAKLELLAEIGKYLNIENPQLKDYDRAVLNFGKNHPPSGGIIPSFEDEIERALRHFDKYQIIYPPSEKPSVLPLLSYQRAYSSFAEYTPGMGNADSADYGNFYVNVPKRGLAGDVLEYVLTMSFNKPYIELAVTQEAIPGRFYQEYAENKASKIKGMADYPCFTNGWAAYSALLAVESGYLSSATASKLAYAKWNFIRSARAYVDVALHTKEMDAGNAFNFFVGDAGMAEKQATGEILKISHNPTQAVSYVLGMKAILKARDMASKKLKDKFNYRDFHRILLSAGKMPIEDIGKEVLRLYGDDKV